MEVKNNIAYGTENVSILFIFLPAQYVDTILSYDIYEL